MASDATDHPLGCGCMVVIILLAAWSFVHDMLMRGTADERRRHKGISRYQLQVGEWDGTTYKWLDQSLNGDESHAAALCLYSTVQAAVKDFENRRAKSQDS